MEELLAVAEARGHGILYRRELVALGATRNAIDGLVTRGVLRPLRPGAYLRGDVTLRPDALYRAHVAASMHLGGSDRIASHWSGAALHGLPLIGVWPRTLHVSSPTATGGSGSRWVTQHRSGPELPTTTVDGILVTTVARTAADLARCLPFASAVAIVDHVLRAGTHRDELLDALSDSGAVHHVARAMRAIAFGDARSASAGESLSRARMSELGYVIPELQVRLVDMRGVDRDVDFFWRDIRKVGEFDGLHKYTRDEYTRAAPAADVVISEKRREDALRPLVGSFDRWVWDDAISPVVFDRFLRDHGVPRDR